MYGKSYIVIFYGIFIYFYCSPFYFYMFFREQSFLLFICFSFPILFLNVFEGTYFIIFICF